MNNPWLHRYAIAVAGATLFLIFAGGLVTSTDSGLSVPDWPLSFGQWFPPMVGGVFYEHGHRMVAATVGLLTIGLAVWLWRAERRRWLRRLGVVALLAVVTQGALGGMTVLFLLPIPVSVGHAGLAQLFFCITVAIAVFTSPAWQRERARIQDSGFPSVKALATATTVIIYIQILIGALVRHTASGLAIPDFPLSFGQLVPSVMTHQVAIHFTHRLGAALVTVMVVWTVVRAFRLGAAADALRKPASFLAAMLLVQVTLGAETVWSGLATLPTTLHVAGGALTLAASLYLTLTAHRVLLSADAHDAIPVHSAA